MKKILMFMLPVVVSVMVACNPPAASNENAMATGTSATNMENLKKFYAFMNSGQMDSLDTYCAADFIDHNPDPMQKGTGLPALKEMFKMYTSASPDMKMEVNNMMADGDMVMIHATISGTNTGAMGPGMPATNKPWKADLYEKIKMKDGKCIERWGVFDNMAMMTQLGMMPPPPAPEGAPAPPAKK